MNEAEYLMKNYVDTASTDNTLRDLHKFFI